MCTSLDHWSEKRKVGFECVFCLKQIFCLIFVRRSEKEEVKESRKKKTLNEEGSLQANVSALFFASPIVDI